MRFGIYGGAFDPVHLGHIAVACAVRDAHRLDRVFIVPARRPPHKRVLAPGADRLEMVRLALGGETGMEASAAELRRPGPSFTVDTLEAFRREFPQAELFLVVGADSISEMRGWRSLARIFDLARLVAVNRTGHAVCFTPQAFPGVSERALESARRDQVSMAPCDVSSTEIRERLARGDPCADFLHPDVARYIASHGLYRGPDGVPKASA
jgi:nicotinate-nucleotide adenylyltransferase